MIADHLPGRRIWVNGVLKKGYNRPSKAEINYIQIVQCIIESKVMALGCRG